MRAPEAMIQKGEGERSVFNRLMNVLNVVLICNPTKRGFLHTHSIPDAFISLIY
jgi:hypothetical protein